MKKIIFLTSQPLEQRNFYRFGLDLFIKENWKIIYCYFNISNTKYDFLDEEKKVKTEDLKNIEIHNISNLKELNKVISKIEYSYYADFAVGSIFKIYANLKLERKNTRLAFEINNYPTFYEKNGFKKITKNIKNFLILKNSFFKISHLIVVKINIYIKIQF